MLGRAHGGVNRGGVGILSGRAPLLSCCAGHGVTCRRISRFSECP